MVATLQKRALEYRHIFGVKSDGSFAAISDCESLVTKNGRRQLLLTSALVSYIVSSKLIEQEGRTL